MVPGVMLLRSLVGLCFWGGALGFTSSPEYHLGAFATGCTGKHVSLLLAFGLKYLLLLYSTRALSRSYHPRKRASG